MRKILVVVMSLLLPGCGVYEGKANVIRVAPIMHEGQQIGKVILKHDKRGRYRTIGIHQVECSNCHQGN